MVTINVHLFAFGEDCEVREVEIPMEPEAWAVLNLSAKLDFVFHYGQNDFQPKQQYSVSVGDVIDLDDQHYLVCGMGFRRLTLDEFNNMPQLHPSLRALMALSKEANV